MSSALRRVFSYVFYERNPLVQVSDCLFVHVHVACYSLPALPIYYVQCLYVAVMCSSYYMFVTEAHPLIPNAYVDAYHKYACYTSINRCYAVRLW